MYINSFWSAHICSISSPPPTSPVAAPGLTNMVSSALERGATLFCLACRYIMRLYYSGCRLAPTEPIQFDANEILAHLPQDQTFVVPSSERCLVGFLVAALAAPKVQELLLGSVQSRDWRDQYIAESPVSIASASFSCCQQRIPNLSYSMPLEI